MSMKTLLLIVLLVGVGAAGFWYVTENYRKDKAETYRRQQIQAEKDEQRQAEREAREHALADERKAEAEKIRKERAEALAKDDAVRMFLSYLDREEERVNDEIEELKIKIEKVGIDQDSMSEELKAIERANAVRVASKEKRNEQQRDKIERVSAMLRSETLNRLARTYCGEDFAALRAQFESEMQKIKDIDDRYQKRFKANLQRYEETVKDADKIVGKKLKKARVKYEAISKRMNKDNQLPKLKKQYETIMHEIALIDAKQAKSSWDVRHRSELQKQMLILQNQISQYEDIYGLASADMAHMEATEAESEARRKYDSANKTLTLDNDTALMERDYEQDVYNTAARYEDRSLGMVRAAMLQRQMNLGEALGSAERKMAYLKKSAVNIEFLNASEIEEVRRNVAAKISQSIMEVEK